MGGFALMNVVKIGVTDTLDEEWFGWCFEDERHDMKTDSV